MAGRTSVAWGADLVQGAARFADWRRGLWAIDFFMTRQEDNVLRSLREVISRATLDQRESKLLRAMGIEMVRFLERKGLDPERPPGETAADLGRPPVRELGRPLTGYRPGRPGNATEP